MAGFLPAVFIPAVLSSIVTCPFTALPMMSDTCTAGRTRPEIKIDAAQQIVAARMGRSTRHAKHHES